MATLENFPMFTVQRLFSNKYATKSMPHESKTDFNSLLVARKKMFEGKYVHFYLQKITFFMYLFCLLVFVLLLHRYCIKYLQLSMFEKFFAKVHKFNSLSLTAFLLHLNIFTWTFEFQFLQMWTCKTYFVMKGSFQLFLSVLFSINY